MAISKGEAQAQKFAQRPEIDVPSISMFTLPRDHCETISQSWFGGQPRMPATIDWPMLDYTDHASIHLTLPLHFVLQLDLSELPSLPAAPRLPASGSLLVFFDPLFSDVSDIPFNQPLKRGEGVSVIYLEASPADYPVRACPEFPDLSGVSEFNISPYAQGKINYERHSIIFEADKASRVFNDELCAYSADRDNNAVGQSFLDRQNLNGLLLEDLGVHQVFGVTLRDYIPVTAYFDARPPETLLANYHPLDDDHTLLFSLRSDPNVGFPDQGSEAYGFWIKESDLVKQCFDNVVVWREFE